MTFVKQNYRAANNIFDELFNTVPTWNRALNVPPVNIHENEDGYHIELQVPGLQKDDVKINVEKGLLTVSYEKRTDSNEQKNYKTHRKEFAVSSFKRSFTLDEKVNADEIKAKYDAGVLRVFLPKKEEVKISPKQIEIQ